MDGNLKYTAIEAWSIFNFSPHQHAPLSLVSFWCKSQYIEFISPSLYRYVIYFNKILCSKKRYFLSAPRFIFYLYTVSAKFRFSQKCSTGRESLNASGLHIQKTCAYPVVGCSSNSHAAVAMFCIQKMRLCHVSMVTPTAAVLIIWYRYCSRDYTKPNIAKKRNVFFALYRRLYSSNSRSNSCGWFHRLDGLCSGRSSRSVSVCGATVLMGCVTRQT